MLQKVLDSKGILPLSPVMQPKKAQEGEDIGSHDFFMRRFVCFNGLSMQETEHNCTSMYALLFLFE